MNFDAKIKKLDKELENCKRYIEYVDDNLKELHNVLDEFNEIKREIEGGEDVEER